MQPETQTLREGQAASPTVRQVSLSYPSAWDRPPREEAAAYAEQEARRWMDEFGLTASDDERTRWGKVLVPSLYACHCFPFASPARQAVIAKFCALWTAHDDLIEHHGLSVPEVRRIEAAIVGDTPGPTAHVQADRFTLAWADLGLQLRAGGMSTRWITRLASDLAAWYATVGDARLEGRGGNWPTTEQYWALRPANSGQTTWLDLLEYAMGRELSAEDRDSTEVQGALDYAQRIYVYFNDLHGVVKDLTDDLANLVVLTASERQISAADAAELLAHEHRDAVQRFEAFAERAKKTRPTAAWWLDGVCDYHMGMVRAHQLSPRYLPVQAVDDGSAIQILLKTDQLTSATSVASR
jgi:Terpene synthase family 2, C-terminal metal binding